MEKVKITTPFITLGQFLKFAGFISNGSEAKFFLMNNTVLIDSELENRRGRKIYKDMVVQVNNEKYQITSEE